MLFPLVFSARAFQDAFSSFNGWLRETERKIQRDEPLKLEVAELQAGLSHLQVLMCVCACLHTCMHMCCVCVYMRACRCACMHAYECACMCACLYACGEIIYAHVSHSTLIIHDYLYIVCMDIYVYAYIRALSFPKNSLLYHLGNVMIVSYCIFCSTYTYVPMYAICVCSV